MSSSNKRKDDFDKGKSRREKTADDLNFYLKKNKTGLFFISKSYGKFMGLHYELVRNRRTRKPFIFCYTDAGGFYLKIPKEYIQDPEKYLQDLSELDYHTIIVDEETMRYSHIMTFQDIRKFWKRHMSTALGNLNRLQFSGEMSKIDFLHPEKKTLLDPSLVIALKNLFV
jgi:hypothetical protein